MVEPKVYSFVGKISVKDFDSLLELCILFGILQLIHDHYSMYLVYWRLFLFFEGIRKDVVDVVILFLFNDSASS